jgi:hypothetical protein
VLVRYTYVRYPLWRVRTPDEVAVPSDGAMDGVEPLTVLL